MTMQKFNKLFTINTYVQIAGSNGFHKIKEIDKTRKWIKIVGYEGSFQRGHITRFTNKIT